MPGLLNIKDRKIPDRVHDVNCVKIHANKLPCIDYFVTAFAFNWYLLMKV